MNKEELIQKLKFVADISHTIEPEMESIESNCSAIDPTTDKETADWIRSELNTGNESAWCSIVVQARYSGVKGFASLGCCSYRSEKELLENNLKDLTNEALDHLATELIALNINLKKLGL